MSDLKDDNVDKKAEVILQVFKKGEQFAYELLKENEKLRYKILSLQQENENLLRSKGGQDLVELKKQLEQLKKEKEELLRKYEEVEKENIDFAKKYVEIEDENNKLANLYIASYQLHSTLDFNEVMRTIVEIVINLIGGEKFAVLLLNEKANELQYTIGEGIKKEDFEDVSVDEGEIIGNSVMKGESYFSKDTTESQDLKAPIVCVPLKVKEKVIGAIVVYKLLAQKKDLTDLDHELFNLMAAHAATAIFSSKLYMESKRKLTTIQGFIDLLVK